MQLLEHDTAAGGQAGAHDAAYSGAFAVAPGAGPFAAADGDSSVFQTVMNDFDGGENYVGEGEENNVGAYVEVDLEEVDEHPARGISLGGACGGAGEQETDLGGNVLNVDGIEGAAEELESSAVEPESHDVRPFHDEEPSAVESPAALHAVDLHEDTPYDFDTACLCVIAGGP